MEDGDVDEDEGENDHGYGGDPGDDVESARIHQVTHEVATIYQQEDEYQHDGKPDTVTYLRKDEYFLKRGAGNQDDGGADNDHPGVKAVENRGVIELVVDARFETHALADHVRGGQGQDGGGEERGVQEPEREKYAGPLAGQRDEG